MGQIGIKYLDSLAPWKGQGGFGLEKMSQVMKALGSPQDTFASIHVGGTNGKGSVSASLCAILGQTGAKVGLNSSPHLQSVTERIQIDGLPLEFAELQEHSNAIESASKQLRVELSFFEAITACAFLAFCTHKVDWAVVEVGLGGRLDATNVISAPKAAILVSVQHDHEDILGPWPVAIAREKVEIFKPGSIIVHGNLDCDSSLVAKKKARELGCSMFAYGSDFRVERGLDGLNWFKSAQFGSFIIEPRLIGEHQVHNSAVAVACARALGVSEIECQLGLKDVFWPARLEWLGYRGKSLLLDCAHNEEGIDSLVMYLKSKNEPLGLVFSAIGTKNWQSMLQKLLPLVSDVYIVEAKAPNAVPQTEIQSYLSGIGIKSKAFGLRYTECLNAIQSHACSAFLMAGSMYMIGPMREEIAPPSKAYWKRK